MSARTTYSRRVGDAATICQGEEAKVAAAPEECHRTASEFTPNSAAGRHREHSLECCGQTMDSDNAGFWSHCSHETEAQMETQILHTPCLSHWNWTVLSRLLCLPNTQEGENAHWNGPSSRAKWVPRKRVLAYQSLWGEKKGEGRGVLAPWHHPSAECSNNVPTPILGLESGASAYMRVPLEVLLLRLRYCDNFFTRLPPTSCPRTLWADHTHQMWLDQQVAIGSIPKDRSVTATGCLALISVRWSTVTLPGL